jgi:hypothetical protein
MELSSMSSTLRIQGFRQKLKSTVNPTTALPQTRQSHLVSGRQPDQCNTLQEGKSSPRDVAWSERPSSAFLSQVFPHVPERELKGACVSGQAYYEGFKINQTQPFGSGLTHKL